MEERLNALQVALTNEMWEHEFYLNNAKRTANAVGKAMFQQIAAEELEHYERLQQLSDIWKKQEKWPATVPLQVKGTTVKDVLKAVVKKAANTPAGDADDLQAVGTAIDFEAQGAAFYARLRDQSTEARERAFFALLASIEQEHFSSLKDTEEYLTNPAGWYQKAERSGLDGA
jgi:rubrerythrin